MYYLQIFGQYAALTAFIIHAMSAIGSLMVSARVFDVGSLKRGFGLLMGFIMWTVCAALDLAAMFWFGGPVWFLELMK